MQIDMEWGVPHMLSHRDGSFLSPRRVRVYTPYDFNADDVRTGPPRGAKCP